MEVTSTPGASATYVSGERIQVTVTTSAPVTLTGGAPSLALTIGGSAKAAALKSGSGTTSLMFEYTVGVQDADTDGLSIGALALGGAAAKDGAGADVALSVPAVSNNASHRVQGERFLRSLADASQEGPQPQGRDRSRSSSSTRASPTPPYDHSQTPHTFLESTPQEPRGSRSARTWTGRPRRTPSASRLP